MQKKETTVIASSLRTKNYVLDRLYKESQQSDSDASRVRALELLGKSVSLFSDVVETKETTSCVFLITILAQQPQHLVFG